MQNVRITVFTAVKLLREKQKLFNEFIRKLIHCQRPTLRKKAPTYEVISGPYLVRIQENTDQQ